MNKFKPFGLRGSMVSILFIIGKQKNIHQKQISDALVLDPSTMSRDLKKLLDKGWVHSQKSKNDPRKSELELTKSGYQLLEEISPIWHALHIKVESILGSLNIKNIDNITKSIITNLTDLKT